MSGPSPGLTVETFPNRSPKAKTKSPRLLGLDLLRFLAIVIVICSHVQLGASHDSFSYRFFDIASRAGYVGVTLFFVLSGFLISGLLFREYQETGGVRLKRFLIRRGWKIYPALWGLVLFTVILCMVSKNYRLSKWGLLGELFFLQNYIHGLWFHTWSLAVEEHFYFLLAGLVFLMLRRSRGSRKNPGATFSSIPAIFVVLAVGCLIGRIMAVRSMGPHYFNVRPVLFLSHVRLDSLMFGVLLSYWWHFCPPERFRDPVRRFRVPLLILGAAFLAPAYIFHMDGTRLWLPVYGLMLFSLAGGMMLLGLLSFSNLERVPLLSPLGKMGSYSYSVYLWHGPIVAAGMPWLKAHLGSAWNDWWAFFALFIGTWVIGIVAAKAIELPVLRLRERFVPIQLSHLK
jgi:peptidoglycan/LPS O-acetylase OafA/YrhL